MHTPHAIRPLTPEQRREWVDTVAVFEAYTEARERLRHYKGGMSWKKVAGHEYLIQILDSHGRQKSLGRRTPETEAQFDAFHRGKAAAQERSRTLKEKLQERARIARAFGLGRIPRVVADIVRRVQGEPEMARRFRLIGTHALHAYEGAAGIQFDSGLLATGDVDWLWDNRLQIDVKGMDEAGFLGLLKAVDPSFEKCRRPFTASNNQGFMVDLISPSTSPPIKPAAQTTLGDREKDLETADVPGLSWLVSTPRFEAVIIDTSGYPVRVPTVDPRAFALHKLWVSEQPERDPVKRERDRLQAAAVLEAVTKYLPHYPLDPEAEALSGLPQVMRQRILEFLPAGGGEEFDDDFPEFPT